MIEIKFNNAKRLMLLILSIMFVTGGVWLLFYTPVIAIPILGNPIVMKIVGAAGILFFGAASSSIFRKIISSKPALIISEEGITDNSSGVSAGFIPWDDITEINEISVSGNHFINIVVKDPEKYIDRRKNPIQRKIAEANFRMYGSVAGISCNMLSYTHSELYSIISTRFESAKEKTGHNNI